MRTVPYPKLFITIISLTVSATVIAQQRTIIFRSGANNVWKVPSNVSIITIEAWGGGGGGGNATGGQGAGYFKAQFPVKANAAVSCVIGTGGNGGIIGNDGANTNVVYQEPGKSIAFTASGGQGGANNNSLVKGDFSFTTLTPVESWNLYWIGAVGQLGSITKTIALTATDGNNVMSSEAGGDGGESGNSVNTKGWGGSATAVLKPNKPFTNYVVILPLTKKLPTAGIQPGGGGGAMPDLSTPSTTKEKGAIGGDGLVIITY
jgi:hypothetical protein